MIELYCESLSVRCIWLYVLITSRTYFRVNPHSIATWLSRKSFFKTGAISDCNRTRTHNHLVRKQILNSQIHFTDKYSHRSSVISPVWLNGWVFIYELSGCGFESHCNPNDNSLACATTKMKSNVVSMCCASQEKKQPVKKGAEDQSHVRLLQSKDFY